MERCGGVKKCVGVWGEVRGEVWGCEEVCWGVGQVRERCGEVWREV